MRKNSKGDIVLTPDEYKRIHTAPSKKTLRLFKKMSNEIKDLSKNVKDMYGVIFGNPTHEKGIITRLSNLETTVKNNTKLSWIILATIIGTAIAVIWKS